MAQGKEITYYDETYIVPDTVIAEIADKGIRTRYESQCNNCIAFKITDEEKAANAELWSWCIVKCWKCKEVYKHTLLQGVAQETAERVRQEVEGKAAERVLELEREIAELEDKRKGIDGGDRRSRGKSFGAFERRWYILFEVLYGKAKSESIGTLSRTTKAKLYRVGYALLCAFMSDRETFNLTAAAEGISKETTEQVYQYISQNPPNDKLRAKAQKKGMDSIRFDW